MKKKLKLDTYGKVTQYGGTYKVGDECTVMLLEKIGWTLVKRTSSYFFLKPPEGKGCKRPIVEVEIPTDEEVIKLANDLHEKGEDFVGEYRGWLVKYIAAYRLGGEWVTRSAIHDENGNFSHWKEKRRRDNTTHAAKFEIGSYWTWNYWIKFPKPDRKDNIRVIDLYE